MDVQGDWFHNNLRITKHWHAYRWSIHQWSLRGYL